ncbi:uncharacterized protein LOC141606954 [Silene latifolia]|uniref:uncharacterized protein LOC141606954 n=1 Tax=Silene latifolia TaxID=37657 RepID=UPI003D78985E
MGRAPCCDKANVKKGPWSPEEDAKLKSYIEKHGMGGNWIALPQKIGLKRCGKSCRLRWLNYLRPNIKHGGFSEEEDKIILSLYVSIGSRWSIIAAQLPGRTDNDIKNYWNTRLKKKLFAKQRKDQQNARRGSNNNLMIKQELGDYNILHQNPSTSNNTTIFNNNNNQIPYYSQISMPSTTSFPNFPNQCEPFQCLDNDHTSIRKMLIKVGQNNYNTINDNNPSYNFDNSYHIMSQINNHYSVATATVTTSEMQNPSHDLENVGVEMGLLGDQNTTFPVELEELMSSNPQRVDGLDFLYGDYGNNLVNNNGDGESSTSRWGEMSSLASFTSNLNCSNHVLLQGIEEVTQFDEDLEFSSKL